MTFSLRFPDLPPRSPDRPSFRRYALRRRDVEGFYGILPSPEGSPQARNMVYAALALLALVMGLLWAFEGRSASVASIRSLLGTLEPAPEIRLIPLLTADTL